MASLWSPSTVVRADKEVVDVVGLVVSQDGLTAHVDVRAALTHRIKIIKSEHLEAWLTSKDDLLVQFQCVMTRPLIDLFPCTYMTH
jgi:hypothetical protein